MKRKTALFLAIVIALVSVLFAACDKQVATKEKPPKLKEVIEGEWQIYFDNEVIAETVCEELAYYLDVDSEDIMKFMDLDELDSYCYVNFSDGEYEFKLDDDYIEELQEITVAAIEDYCERYLDEETSYYILSDIDYDVEYYLDDLEEKLSDIKAGYYKVKKKTVYFAGSERDLEAESRDTYMKCVVNKDTIEITDAEGMYPFIIDGNLPIIMTKYS